MKPLNEFFSEWRKLLKPVLLIIILSWITALSSCFVSRHHHRRHDDVIIVQPDHVDHQH
jgi:hypothetical protein